VKARELALLTDVHRGAKEEQVPNVRDSQDLHLAAHGLVERCLDTFKALSGVSIGAVHPPRGGRKAHELDVHAQI